MQIDEGFEMEKFYDHEKIVYRITPSYRFDEYLTPGYIMKVYAFNVAVMEACVIGFLVIWGFPYRIYDHSHRKM